MLRKSRRLRRCVGVECCFFDVAPARPESRADYFVRVGLARDGIGPFALRRAPSREPGHRQIEAAPEEMYRTYFSNEPGPELFKDRVAADENPPETVGILRIVGTVLCVLIE